MKTITRAKYLDRIIELNGTPDIKIITGIRRSGKSKLMQAYIAYLKSNFENINIIFIDFMDLAYEEIKEYHALHAYVEEHYQEGKTNYLFVDEVQMCPKFELAINSLYSKGKYDIYVTGSNAFLLSADLATLRLTLDGVGVQQRQRPGLCIGEVVHLLGHLVPLGLRVNGQAVLRADGDVERVAQGLPHGGGDHQTALGVDAVVGFSQQPGHG